jgi:hypothetical protein
MKKTITLFSFALLFITFLQAQEPKLKKIFTGKNLKGWKVLPTEQNSCWSAAKGILFVKSNTEKALFCGLKKVTKTSFFKPNF